MEPSEYQMMYEVEDRHWWYVGMRRLTMQLLHRVYGDRPNLMILDAGCGTGAAAMYLSSFGTVTGLDFSPLALSFCQQRGLRHLNRGTVTQLPFPDASFDLITSFDVLYHKAVGAYRKALAEFHRVLKPHGRILLRLPAYNWLRGHHDEVIHTEHRFTAGELRRALTEAGFFNEKITYANSLLFPVAVGKRLLDRFLAIDHTHSDVRPNSPWQDHLLAGVLGVEARWLTHFNLPFGLSVITLGRKLA
jgi:SAM-dependent methyltransferase